MTEQGGHSQSENLSLFQVLTINNDGKEAKVHMKTSMIYEFSLKVGYPKKCSLYPIHPKNHILSFWLAGIEIGRKIEEKLDEVDIWRNIFGNKLSTSKGNWIWVLGHWLPMTTGSQLL